MTFFVAADAYDRFMGRYSRLLSPQLADLAGIGAGQRVVDVGCGPGALTAELVARVGAENVAAVDPSAPFVEAARERHPGVTVLEAPAESMPFGDDEFDASLAQLVVHFMTDPVAGLREMRRVTRPGGSVAASVWDIAGDRAPISVFWQVVRDLDPAHAGEGDRPGAHAGDLAELFTAAGMRHVVETTLAVSREHATFDEWWEPFTGGVGPAGAYLQAQDAERQAEIRDRCRAILGDGPFTIAAHAWAVRGTA